MPKWLRKIGGKCKHEPPAVVDEIELVKVEETTVNKPEIATMDSA